MLHRPKLRKRMCLVDQLPCGSVLTPAISCTKFRVHSAHGDSPMAKTLFLFLILREDQSLFHRPKLRKRMCLVDQLPFGSVLTPAISCTKFKVHSAHADSPMAKTLFLFFNFKGGTSLCFTDQNSGRECAWWTNSLVGQFLHQLSLVQSSGSIQLMETVPWPKHFFFF